MKDPLGTDKVAVDRSSTYAALSTIATSQAAVLENIDRLKREIPPATLRSNG